MTLTLIGEENRAQDETSWVVDDDDGRYNLVVLKTNFGFLTTRFS